MSITGEEGGPPIKPGAPIADLAAALYAANAIQAAYIHKLRTGEGQYLDVSLFEAAVALEPWETSGYFANGEVPKPLGSAHRTSAPYQAFRTSDGFVTIGATSVNNWRACCKVLGIEHLENDPRFATNAVRKPNQEELAGIIEAITKTNTSDYWYRKFEEGGVPCGVLNRIDQVAADPHLQERGFLVDLAHTTNGKVRATGSPMHFSQTPVRLERAGPLLGEHTAAILAAVGVDAGELGRLEADGVVKRAVLPANA
mgnify:CR=1 FL=1